MRSFKCPTVVNPDIRQRLHGTEPAVIWLLCLPGSASSRRSVRPWCRSCFSSDTRDSLALATEIHEFYEGQGSSFSLILRSVEEERRKIRAVERDAETEALLNDLHQTDAGRVAELRVLDGTYHGRSLQRHLDGR
jgi:hypothetical protein